jgi:hypothetical protein
MYRGIEDERKTELKERERERERERCELKT